MEKQRINDIAFAAGRWPLDPERETIVFIHGAGGSNLLWHHQVEALSDRVNTVAPDLPGHGESGGQAMESVEDYAKSVSGFIRDLGVKRALICGLSMGGAIVLQLLIDEPESFSGAIVANSGARLKVQPAIFEMIENDFNGFVNGMYTVGISPKTDPSTIRPLIEQMEICPPAVTKGDFAACSTFDVMDRIASIQTPVLVITSADDQMTPVKYGQYMAEQIPGARMVTLEDAGHLAPLEKPEQFNQVLRDFMG